MMKTKIFLTLLVLFNAIAAFACPACEKQQSEFLSGISHGAGPQTRFDYLIVSVVSVIVLATLYFSLKWIFRPGERNVNHIKRTILNFE